MEKMKNTAPSKIWAFVALLVPVVFICVVRIGYEGYRRFPALAARDHFKAVEGAFVMAFQSQSAPVFSSFSQAIKEQIQVDSRCNLHQIVVEAQPENINSMLLSDLEFDFSNQPEYTFEIRIGDSTKRFGLKRRIKK